MNTTQTTLPHWDVSTVYSKLDAPEFEVAFTHLVQAIYDMETLFNTEHIQLLDTPPILDTSLISRFETVITRVNTISTEAHTLYAYISAFVTTDSRNATAQALNSRLQMELVRLNKLEVRLTAWLGSLDIEPLITTSQVARGHAYALRKAQIESQHLMSPAEETLVAELDLVSGKAWAKLYNNFSSQITQTVEIDNEAKVLPMTALRNLAFDPDAKIREHAYRAELAAWEANALPIAAALNSIKGQMNLLSARRGWESPLAVALHENHIDAQTLDTMLAAAREHFPNFRRYLKAKARLLNTECLAWYDLFAPVGKSEKSWSYTETQNFIIKEFGNFSHKLRALAERAFNEDWIDAEPRDGKRGGAFCMWLRGDESRILSNYQPSYDGMSTLAHELGHAYHNLARSGCTYIQRQTPMTLAETASNFCEILVRDAALKAAPPQEQIAILEAFLQGACQVVVDITSRFLFETEVFEKRKTRELAVEELNTLMLESQRATYGEGLDSQKLHPYMWAVKPHYYGSTFYNFPYMFGLLFSLGLYTHYRQKPEAFIRNYDDLLSATGVEDATTLAMRFGINLHAPDFWHNSLTLIDEDIARFEVLVNSSLPL
ncbi:MAG: M3 family oligoendopeptidase [Anaerolineae bacterium]|nr:M3 family oligoendopeptidase [Anaerolineae bacterium]